MFIQNKQCMFHQIELKNWYYYSYIVKLTNFKTCHLESTGQYMGGQTVPHLQRPQHQIRDQSKLTLDMNKVHLINSFTTVAIDCFVFYPTKWKATVTREHLDS